MSDAPSPRNSLVALLERNQTLLLAGLLVGSFGGALIASDWLGFDPRKDERHYWRTTLEFVADPWTAIGEYQELATPGAFLIWSSVERALGGGVPVGRATVWLASLAMVVMVGLRAGRGTDSRALLATLGLLIFPYTLPLSVHLYTDAVAACFILAGTCLTLSDRRWLGALAFALAIATRQYAVIFPLALAADSGWRWLWNREGSWQHTIPPLVAALTLGAWILYFGGLVPPNSLERWPTPQLDVAYIRIDFALYFLACFGVYFVLPESLLLRRIDWLRGSKPRRVAISVALAAAFWLFPPDRPDVPYGLLDRITRLPDAPLLRNLALFGAAWIGAVRLARIDLLSWLVMGQAALMTRTWIPWDKYNLALFAVLWFLIATRTLDERES